MQRYDVDGNPVSLQKLCRIEPDWAASRIEGLEAEVARLTAHLNLNKCGAGHETLPLRFWNCPACADEAEARWVAKSEESEAELARIKGERDAWQAIQQEIKESLAYRGLRLVVREDGQWVCRSVSVLPEDQTVPLKEHSNVVAQLAESNKKAEVLIDFLTDEGGQPEDQIAGDVAAVVSDLREIAKRGEGKV